MGQKKGNDKSLENLKFENEVRKAKMIIEQGAHFGGGENTPPEVESAFLDHIEQFEKEYNKCKRITVQQRLGMQSFRMGNEIDEEHIKDELNRLMEAMQNHGLI